MKASLEYFLRHPKTILELSQGPIADYLERYAQHLHTQGYARHTGRYHLSILGQFNNWLAKRRIDVTVITPIVSEQFLKWRRHRIRGHSEDRLIVARLLAMLPPRVAEEIRVETKSETEQTLQAYQSWLERRRGLSKATVTTYKPYICRFLTQQFSHGQIDFTQLTPKAVTDFVQQSTKQLKSSVGLRLQVTALRSFLGYLLEQGKITTPLDACIPAVANWSFSNVPKFLSPEQIRKTLDHCRRDSAQGKRNYAILLLLARLGLRAGEVVALTLDDLDWEQGLLTVHGKGQRTVQVPLPADVGEAIAEYLQFGRPQCDSCRRVFIRDYAPLVGFAGSASVCGIVAQALQQANVESVRQGSHLFRHSLATHMLNTGSSLAEIGEILRHRRPETTRIYAKVDLESLRTIALAWPGGAL